MRTIPRFVLLLPLLLAPALSAVPATQPATRPATQPAAVLVDLPDGWVPRTSATPGLSQYAWHPGIGYFQLVTLPASDFDADFDARALAELCKPRLAKESKLQGREETDLTERTIAGRKVVQYEITGESHGLKLHYRLMSMEVRGRFCQLICWSLPSEWAAAQPAFDELVKRLK